MTSAYKKNNSFTEVGGYDLADVKRAIRRVLDKRFGSSLYLNDTRHSRLLDESLQELNRAVTQPNGTVDNGIFNPFDLCELAVLPEELWSRFLIYRYKYVVFPAKKRIDAYPPCVQIEPTSICNLRCKFCYQVDEHLSNKSNGFMGQMDFDLFKLAIDQLVGNVEALTLASRGEPTLAKAFPSMMSYLKGKFIGLKINTNATRLTDAVIESILDAEPAVLVFSMDSANKEEYEAMRVNARFEKVVSNIKRVVEIKSTNFSGTRTMLRVSGVNYEGNDSGYESLAQHFGDSLDQIALVDMVPWIDPYNAPKSRITDPCSDLWRRMFIWWDGSIGVCDVDYLQTIKVGKFGPGGKTLSQIWAGAEYQKLRADHSSGQRLGVCSQCQVC